MIDRTFGRLREFDERSRLHAIRPLVKDYEVVTKLWPCSKVLDQGSEGSCVGHGIAHELIAEPVPVHSIDHNYAVKIYGMAKTMDSWPGEDYEGTSVLAGMKAAKKLGWYDEYRWAFTLDDIILGVGLEGPAVMGTNWYTGMTQTDSGGFVNVTGQNEGGHCWLINGVNIEGKHFEAVNSWGEAWGEIGKFRITWNDLWKLMENSGECCLPIGRKNPEVKGRCDSIKTAIGRWC